MILYIGPKIDNPTNGGDMIDYRNQSLLKSIFKSEVYFVEPSTSSSFFSRLSFGLDKKKKDEIQGIMEIWDIKLAFVSQSFYGAFAKHIKKQYKIPVISFFHNAEIDFFADKLKIDGFNLHWWAYFKKIVYYEKMSIRVADRIVVLNIRDSDALYSHYGRKADFVLPTTFKDVYSEYPNETTSNMDIDYLFLGSAFFANIEGCKWFIENILPELPGKMCIAGRGMDKVGFQPSERLSIIGFVSNLADLYNRAKVVVSPILSGSGMKTKTAEALMYGKTIVGTTEAFEGYVINDKCMFKCDSAGEFVDTLNELVPQIDSPINIEARKHFLSLYSNDSVMTQFKEFIMGLV